MSGQFLKAFSPHPSHLFLIHMGATYNPPYSWLSIPGHKKPARIWTRMSLEIPAQSRHFTYTSICIIVPKTFPSVAGSNHLLTSDANGESSTSHCLCNDRSGSQIRLDDDRLWFVFEENNDRQISRGETRRKHIPPDYWSCLGFSRVSDYRISPNLREIYFVQWNCEMASDCILWSGVNYVMCAPELEQLQIVLYCHKLDLIYITIIYAS